MNPNHLIEKNSALSCSQGPASSLSRRNLGYGNLLQSRQLRLSSMYGEEQWIEVSRKELQEMHQK
jgi:hypothetical protein